MTIESHDEEENLEEAKHLKVSSEDSKINEDGDLPPVLDVDANNVKENKENKVIESAFIEKLKEANLNYIKEYFDQIPIEKGKYYRVTGMSEIYNILKNKALKPVEEGKSYFDRHILTHIANNSHYTMDQLEEINSTETEKIRDLHKIFVQEPANKKGKIVINPRSKSNHGVIGFQKEGFYYDPITKGTSHFGAPVIVGSENKSLFQAGHHGCYSELFNKDIESNSAVVLRDGYSIYNFEIWLYEDENKWAKYSFIEDPKLESEAR